MRTDATPIDRRAVVDRHAIELTAAHPEHVLSVGNGDFAFTADVTGMQTFTDFHSPALAVRRGETAVNTCTMSSWGWHEMPNPEGFVLDDAMSTYETARGPVSYPDRYDMQAAMQGQLTDEMRPGAWLHANPQRMDLGRIGLELRQTSDAAAEADPSVLRDIRQVQDLWTGEIRSSFTYAGSRVDVVTVADPDASTVAFRIRSALLADGRARVGLRFPYPSDGFFQTDDWDAGERHESTLRSRTGGAVVERIVDAARYSVALDVTGGRMARGDAPHAFHVDASGDELELVAAFRPDDDASAPATSFAEVRERSAAWWARFWESGAAVDLAASSDPRAPELERRVVLSQALTAVHCSGHLPPAETGLVTNSWQGKFHLEMHWWHAAHFAMWGRPELLERSLDWYLTVLDSARDTAARQGYPGARWPKQAGPDGRESPDPIGSLIAWQQPHVLYLLDLVWRATPEAGRAALVARFGELVEETAAFMAAFPEERDGELHLGPPIMPAQEFYDSRTTTDPTYELAYWWWGLEIAQRWRERAGRRRDEAWTDVQRRLATPKVVDGCYVAVATDEPMRRDDHPSLLMALGFVPETPIIDPEIMSATLDDVWDDWQWPTAWGWDFPVIAMTATRLGRGGLAFDALLRDEVKNTVTPVGHNPQMGAILPLYLPGNGSLLAAVALIAQTGTAAPGWTVRAEGFPA
ncbi:hypothetical protein [Agromyces mangrovi Wang et al. 2018]|uniref:hypothetical protein n=1 Tax=Agromyces mangrovi TaxID=1858653 RepID=UPI0025745EFB|nr:hypothetical protein [Agromyces mangrovi]BDZ64681.1 hypothetical protein GCM10025877_16190 [Agromyces mangrovi]